MITNFVVFGLERLVLSPRHNEPLTRVWHVLSALVIIGRRLVYLSIFLCIFCNIQDDIWAKIVVFFQKFPH
jgi:hypothetical protein